MTPRQRVEQALRGGHSDCVPFTIYETMIPQCTAEREMRNRGLCIVKRDVPVFETHYPNIRVTQHTYWDSLGTDGQGAISRRDVEGTVQKIPKSRRRQMTRTVYETPKGELSTLIEAAGFTNWRHEKMFKTPADYEAIRFLIQDEVYEPTYDRFARAQADFGEDAIFRAQIGLEPLQTLISGMIMGMQDFCIEWMDHRHEVLKLYEALVANRRRIYPIVAQSPASHANYGGNVVPEIIGLKNFERYFVPHYNEAADVMHQHGKLIGCHFDANCKLLSGAIARTDLDYIEAFTPAPNSDMTLGEARQAWPDKVLWLNFPPSVHLKPDAEVAQITVDLLNEVTTVDGLLVGITDDIPPDRWRDSCRAIMNGLQQHAREHPQMY